MSLLKSQKASLESARKFVLVYLARQTPRACYVGELCLELEYWSLEETESLLESMVYEGSLSRELSLCYRLK